MVVKRFLLAVVAAAGLALAQPAPSALPVLGSADVVARPCGSGYRHGVIDGQHKCLRRGQFCRRAADRQYHRYRFHCHGRRLMPSR